MVNVPLEYVVEPLTFAPMSIVCHGDGGGVEPPVLIVTDVVLHESPPRPSVIVTLAVTLPADA
jgi:hypothetical protein